MNEGIVRPTLLLHPDRCRANILAMAEKAKRHGLLFRPHFKTHQSLAVGRWFRDLGTDRIAVSSVKMASYFARDGWKDICIAFPVNFRELDTISELNDTLDLHILVSHPESLERIQARMNRPVGVFLELDAGYGRSGLDAGRPEVIEGVLKQIRELPRLRFSGFLLHSGQTYHAEGKEGVLAVHREALEVIGVMRKRFLEDYPGAVVSLGDTPACSLADDFSGVDECRPGNFVFFDLMQASLGACTEDQVAVSLACPVVARYPERQELVIHGGAVHLSKESLPGAGQERVFGRICTEEQGFFGETLPGAWVRSLSQEHGLVRLPAEAMKHFPPGSLLGILPVHSCLTADCMKGYLTPGGERIDHLEGNGYF